MMTMIMNSSSKCVGIDAICCFCMICTYKTTGIANSLCEAGDFWEGNTYLLMLSLLLEWQSWRLDGTLRDWGRGKLGIMRC